MLPSPDGQVAIGVPVSAISLISSGRAPPPWASNVSLPSALASPSRMISPARACELDE